VIRPQRERPSDPFVHHPADRDTALAGRLTYHTGQPPTFGRVPKVLPCSVSKITRIKRKAIQALRAFSSPALGSRG